MIAISHCFRYNTPLMDPNLQFRLLLTLLLGAFIGLEREIHERSEKKQVRHGVFLGIRTFTLTMMLGGLMGAVAHTVPIFFALVTGAFFLLTMAFYVIDSIHTRDIGITTEIALIYCFVVGALMTLNIVPLQLLVSVTILLALILSRKHEIGQSIRNIQKAQLGSFISYLVLALVILPLLPNVSYSLSSIPQLTAILEATGIHAGALATMELINPFKLWLIVALITGVDVFGYILEQTLGQKGGWMLTSFAGGFISSTATTQSLAQQSRKAKSVNHLVSAAIVANLASFLQVSILILPVSIMFFVRALPVIGSMVTICIVLTLYFLRNGKMKKDGNVHVTQKQLKKNTLFNIVPALKFALLFITIKLVSRIALFLFGNNGFLFSVGLGAIPGIDAVMISVAELSGRALSYETALWAFLLANFVNLGTKSMYSFFQGSRDFALKFSVSCALIMAAGLAGVLISR